MAKRPRTSYSWWCLILNIGIFIFFALTLYGAILRWTRAPYFFTTTQKLLGFGVDAIAIGLLFMSQLHIFRLSRAIRADTIFSRIALRQARDVFLYFLAWTVYVPFQRALEVLVATMHNTVGHRLFVVSFGMPDLVRIMVLTIFAFLVFLLQRGIDLTEDQSLTI